MYKHSALLTALFLAWAGTSHAEEQAGAIDVYGAYVDGEKLPSADALEEPTLAAIRACAGSFAPGGPGFGVLAARLRVSPDGTIAGVAFGRTKIVPAEVQSCIDGALRGVQFGGAPAEDLRLVFVMNSVGASRAKAWRATSIGDEPGGRPKSDIDLGVKSAAADVARCYQAALGRNRAASGTLITVFAITRAGTVSSSVVGASGLNDERLEDCITQIQERYTFGADDDLVLVSYPFVFGASTAVGRSSMLMSSSLAVGGRDLSHGSGHAWIGTELAPCELKVRPPSSIAQGPRLIGLEFDVGPDGAATRIREAAGIGMAGKGGLVRCLSKRLARGEFSADVEPGRGHIAWWVSPRTGAGRLSREEAPERLLEAVEGCGLAPASGDGALVIDALLGGRGGIRSAVVRSSVVPRSIEACAMKALAPYAGGDPPKSAVTLRLDEAG